MTRTARRRRKPPRTRWITLPFRVDPEAWDYGEYQVVIVKRPDGKKRAKVRRV